VKGRIGEEAEAAKFDEGGGPANVRDSERRHRLLLPATRRLAAQIGASRPTRMRAIASTAHLRCGQARWSGRAGPWAAGVFARKRAYIGTRTLEALGLRSCPV